jgi:hypothetical protein
MTARPVSVPQSAPEPERRARIRDRLTQLGEGPAALFHDLCLLLDEDLGLDAADAGQSPPARAGELRP